MAAVAIDTTQTCLVVHVFRRIVTAISIVVLRSQRQIRVASAERLVTYDWIEQALIPMGRLETDGVWRVLIVLFDVLVLIQEVFPILHDGTTRTLVANGTPDVLYPR
jgi:hypothetical protein